VKRPNGTEQLQSVVVPIHTHVAEHETDATGLQANERVLGVDRFDDAVPLVAQQLRPSVERLTIVVNEENLW
jgi:hypothetical protein